ncbi:hypothetical protein [Pseudomonas sp.]|uniref:hypothetical protein n=1 Tax=Pseudomonas sp. TaxID=306 RepID=UPI003D0AB9DB
MNQATVALILGLIPVAEKLIFEVGGKLIELNTENLTREDMLQAIEASKSGNWPALKFQSPRKD